MFRRFYGERPAARAEAGAMTVHGLGLRTYRTLARGFDAVIALAVAMIEAGAKDPVW